MLFHVKLRRAISNSGKLVLSPFSYLKFTKLIRHSEVHLDYNSKIDALKQCTIHN